MGLSDILLFSSNPAADTLFRRITPLDVQIDYLQEKWHELADELLPNLSARYGVPTSTWIQGSYKYQTLLRPFAGEEFDLDLGFYFSWSGFARYGPRTLKDGMQRRLAELAETISGAREVLVPPKERCCRLGYENEFHIDVPVYHVDEPADSRRLARQSDQWEASDPKALYKWFRERIVRTDRQQVRRLVCYLKAWSRLKLRGDDRPSSILLSVLVVEAVHATSFRIDLDDDDALLAALRSIRSRLATSRVVRNPVDGAEDLNRLSDIAFRNLLGALDSAILFANAACTARDLLTAAYAWEWLFAYMIPFPDVLDNASLREAAKAISPVQPEVQVRVISNDHLIGVVKNAVPNARKDYTLDFQVTNGSAFPSGSYYVWTVRNVGDEAETVNDLGHTQEGVNRTAVRERTLYNGRQFMDLTIRNNGKIIGYRRVPVDITGAALPSPYQRRRYGPR